jgi:hypothetical protein
VTTWVVVGDATGEPTSDSCAHLDRARDMSPSTLEGCEDCLREGTQWVHLRECLECGHVGCCDNSRRTHATAHWRSSGHVLMRSFEPGEDWGWCYDDDLFLGPASAT